MAGASPRLLCARWRRGDPEPTRLTYTIEQAAGWLGVDYGTLFRRVALVSALGDPLPAGKTVRALPLFLNPGCKPMKRIPEEELLRVMGLNGKGDR